MAGRGRGGQERRSGGQQGADRRGNGRSDGRSDGRSGGRDGGRSGARTAGAAAAREGRRGRPAASPGGAAASRTRGAPPAAASGRARGARGAAADDRAQNGAPGAASGYASRGPAASAGQARRADRPRSAPPAPPASPAIQLSAAKRKGEWLELKLPDTLAAVPLNGLLRLLPLPPKIAGRLISVNGVQRHGKQLRLKLFPDERAEFEPEWKELNILYEDDYCLVVYKPAGIEVHPSVKDQRGTLAHHVAAYYQMTNQPCRIRHIHRLDKDTTGPVLYAKNELAHYVFDAAMRDKRIERIYVALAEGVLPRDKGVIDAPIGQDRHHSTRRRVSETGEPAVSRYEVIERFADHTLVRMRLETGRTHQIRVHLAHLGHPIAGDGLYGGHRPLMQRQALHGEALVWPHPWTGAGMTVRAPMPDDFAAALHALRT